MTRWSHYALKPWLIADRLLSKSGIKKTQENGFFELLKILKLPQPTSAFQVGASYGQELDYFLSNGIKECACFEPIPSIFKELKGKTDQFGWLAFNVALGSKKSKQTLHLASNKGMSSSILSPDSHITQFPTITFKDTLEINVDVGIDYAKSHSRILSNENNPVLYMDTQGYELEVLKGFGETLENFTYVYTEVGYGFGYKNAASINEICTYLFEHGFEVLDISLSGESGWGDALFAKRSLISGR